METTNEFEEKMADVTKTLKDAAYVTVGLGVITFQKAQVRRQELRKQFETHIQGTRAQVEKLAKQIEGRVEPVIDQLEEKLPGQAKAAVHETRKNVREAQEQLKSLVNRAGGPASAAA
jgi:ferritin-like metal-binding protein YciE